MKLCRKKTNNRIVMGIATAWVVVLMVVMVSFYAVADIDLSETVAVDGLTVKSTGEIAWQSTTAGAVTWSGKTESNCQGMTTVYTTQTGKLVLTNSSGSAKVIKFSYETTLNGGSLTVAGQALSGNGTFSKMLANGASVEITCASPSSSAATTRINLTEIALEIQQITTTFKAPTNGTYTVDGTSITTETSLTNESTKGYKLVATPADNYVFSGWYHGETLLSVEKTYTTIFSSDGTVKAVFSSDPLYGKTTVPETSSLGKDELIGIDSWFYHDGTSKKVLNAGIPTYNSAYSLTAASGVKDARDIQYLPSLQWQVSETGISVSASGTATGDPCASMAERSWADARVFSDVIRIKAKKNCNISFDYTCAFTTGGNEFKNVYFYYFVSKNANETLTTVKQKATVYTNASGKVEELAVSEGDYLYILVEGHTQGYGYASAVSMPYVFSSTITNFTVEYNEMTHILTAGFRDNVDTVLGSGKLAVNGTVYNIGADGNIAVQEYADGSEVKLQVNTPPTGYVHIGWVITPSNGQTSHYYVSTHTLVLSSDCTAYALFVPRMTITMGNYGYQDATYKLFNDAVHTGQYVARNADSSKYYTSLAAAFDDTDKVVLLAGHTFVGDWEIPEGKILVVPFAIDDQGALSPVTISGSIGAQYCKAIVTGGTLTVKGTLLVSARQSESRGTPGGTIGHLSVDSTAKIVVDGILYAYGPIAGEGTIVANPSAKIHEFVEIQDNRGPIGMDNVYNKRGTYEVFPVTAMYFNNIESMVVYHSGSQLIGHACVSFDDPSQAEFYIIGTAAQATPQNAKDGALLILSEGTLTKYYDRSSGQVVFRADEGGVVQTGNFAMNLQATVGNVPANITLDSSDYYIPLNSSIRFEVAGQFTILGNYKFLPGSKLDILQGGKAIIQSGSNVVFYRLNDYDYRGPHKDNTKKWGYSATAYPSNPTRIPGYSYPFSFNISNVGSAKLNVDGELIVNGGLYVTTGGVEDVDNGLTHRDNGYNVLTGYGKISMQGTSSLGKVYEAMSARGTNDIEFAEVQVASIKGLPKTATADDPAQYQSLGNGTWIGLYNTAGYYVWVPEKDVLVLTLEYRLENYLWFNGYFKDAVEMNMTVYEGSVFCVSVDSDVYIVKSISAKEIPDELTFKLSYTVEGTTFVQRFTASLNAYREISTNQSLIDKMIAYGNAAKYYSSSDLTWTGTPSEKPGTNEEVLVSGGNKPAAVGGVQLETTGATVYFDEALRLGIKYSIEYVNLETFADGYSIAQIGLLVGSGDSNLLVSDDCKKYLLYNNIPGVNLTPGGSNNLPEDVEDKPITGNFGSTSGMIDTPVDNGEIVFDLSALQYTEMLDLRPVVVLQKGDNYCCVYGRQIRYGLEAYINGTYTQSKNNEFKNLLEATWEYAVAANTAFGG